MGFFDDVGDWFSDAWKEGGREIVTGGLGMLTGNPWIMAPSALTIAEGVRQAGDIKEIPEFPHSTWYPFVGGAASLASGQGLFGNFGLDTADYLQNLGLAEGSEFLYGSAAFDPFNPRYSIAGTSTIQELVSPGQGMVMGADGNWFVPGEPYMGDVTAGLPGGYDVTGPRMSVIDPDLGTMTPYQYDVANTLAGPPMTMGLPPAAPPFGAIDQSRWDAFLGGASNMFGGSLGMLGKLGILGGANLLGRSLLGPKGDYTPSQEFIPSQQETFTGPSVDWESLYSDVAAMNQELFSDYVDLANETATRTASEINEASVAEANKLIPGFSSMTAQAAANAQAQIAGELTPETQAMMEMVANENLRDTGAGFGSFGTGLVARDLGRGVEEVQAQGQASLASLTNIINSFVRPVDIGATAARNLTTLAQTSLATPAQVFGYNRISTGRQTGSTPQQPDYEYEQAAADAESFSSLLNLILWPTLFGNEGVLGGG